MLVFRQLFDPTSSTYTYLLGCSVTKEAVLIDPVFEQVRRDAGVIAELGLDLKWSLVTHVHADHRGRAVGCAGVPTAGHSRLKGGDWVTFGRPSLELRATPGHTSGCLTY